MHKTIRIIVLIGLAILWGAGASFAEGLTPADAQAIFAACRAAAAATPSPLRGTPDTKMWCAVIDREGTLLLIRATDTGGTPTNPLGSDAWRGSIEIAIAKAYTGLAFSSNDLALDSKTIGVLAQPGGDLFGIGNSNPYRPLTGVLPLDDNVGQKHHGIITFPGGEPVYRCASGVLVGGIGVSGDGVVQDEAVAEAAITNAGFCLTP